ncbi:SusC/RagA family TonB-linked outer membrane protein [Bacteroidia bacterium]|nr:SusC/RagA family TonB-linked outer membrane protein [Bacteroidia bacterium]
MYIKNLLIILMLLLVGTSAMAQTSNFALQGVVVDAKGDPLAGVTVAIKGTTQGVSTDVDGKFSLSVAQGATLSFGFMGLKSQEVRVTSQEWLRVVMHEDAIELEETVVIGYGTAKKEELTSAVVKVGKEDFNPGVTNNLVNLIAGKVPGLVIRNTAGNDPNASPEILLRGIGSVRAGSTPLVIIDGVYASIADLNSLSAQDIESFNVLKDGSSAAIYGTRGSNGVIIVETRKGAAGRSTVEYSSDYYVETPTRKLDVMTAEEYLGLLAKKGLSAANNDYGFSTDWMSEMVKPAFGHSQNVSFATGTENSELRASVGYRQADGILLNTGNKQTNGHITFKQFFFDKKLRIEGTASGANRKMQYTDYGALNQALIYHPTAPVRAYDDNFFEFQGLGAYNPVALLSQESNRGERFIYSGSLLATLDLLPTLKLTAMAAHNNENEEGSHYITRESRRSVVDNKEGTASTSSHFYKKNTLELYGTYNFVMNEHNATLVAGYSYNDEKRVWDNASNSGFLNDQLGAFNIGNGTYLEDGRATLGRGGDEARLIAFFGRASYSYNGKYLFNASLRREGSTRFGENNKWGWFPAVSVGWRITEEEFMQGIDVLSNLKLRAGYGLTGNQDIPRYQSIAKLNDLGYTYYNNAWQKAYGPINNSNPNLRWEKNSEYNFGLDIGLFKNSLTASIDYYYRKTTDLLDWYDAQIPASIYSTIFTNVGTLTNKGVEFTVGYDLATINTSLGNFNWHIDAGASYNQNELVSLSNDTYKANHIIYNTLSAPATGQPTYILEEGKPIGTYYGLQYKGITSQGKWVFNEVVEDGSYDDKDYQYLGSGLPTWNFSLANTFRYGNFDLSFQMRGAAGFEVLNVKRVYYENTVSLPFNLLSSVLDKNLNDAAVFSDYYLEKGDYLKLTNVTLGYTLNLKNKVPYISAVRVYATGSNLYTFTGYTGVDPEVGSGLTPGFDNAGYYPRSATFLVGLNITF